MIVPSLSALLASPATDMVLVGQLLGDERPPLCAVLGHELDDGVVLLNIEERG